MKGDFTRFPHDPQKHYSRVLKQQGRVDLDADWNEAVEIFHHLERSEARDVIGRCGVPEHSNGYKIDRNSEGTDLTISRGRIYVNGILCTNEVDPEDADADQPISITDQKGELPGYPLPDTSGVYLAYVDVWERHITGIEDPEIREVALGGPDTTTRTRTQCQVKLEPLGEDGPLEDFECRPFTGIANSGRLAAQSEQEDTSTNPCVVPASAGYRGLENRLYRVEIHDDGRDVDGNQVRTPTFKWSRDNGSVVLPVADDGIDGDEVTVKRFGPDDVLTVKVGDWVEVSGDTTELYGRHGTLGQIEPDGIDKATLEITLSTDVSLHQGEKHLKLRRWDHHARDEVALQNGALPIQGDWFELEDGVQIRFDATATYHVGDYWVIPARTREGTVLWPKDGAHPAERRRLGIEHHYCTLALVRRVGNVWTEVRDCRNLFLPLTEIGGGCCCLRVMPGEDIQQAIDTVIGAGGGCVSLCAGVHEVEGALHITDGEDVSLLGQGAATVMRFHSDQNDQGGLVIENGRRVTVADLFMAGNDVMSLITVLHNDQWALNRSITLRGLTLVNTATSTNSDLRCGVRLSHTEGVVIQDCRIAAEAGIVSLWGNALPDITAEGQDEGVVRVGFEQPQVGTQYRVGDSLTERDITVTGESFTLSSGQTISDGVARIGDQGRAGGSGKDIQTSNINLNFDLSAAYAAARLNFGNYDGAVNLSVNGQLRVGSIFALNGQTIGGVVVSVTLQPDSQQLGTLTLSRSTQPITMFSIGGQELWIDEVEFRDPITPLDLTYGDGVRGLVLEDTTIRFRDFGLLSAVSDGWTLQRSDIRTHDAEVFTHINQLLADATSRQDFADGLASLELLWNQVGPPTQGSVGLTTLLWRDSTVCQCVLGADLGIVATCWVRGVVRETRITGDDIGLFAFWLHDAIFTRNRITATAGTALAFAGCYRTRVDHNDLRGLVGIGDLSLSLSVQGLRLVLHGLLRGYGDRTGSDGFVLFWIMVEQSVDVMGLRELIDALQELLDEELNGIPLIALVAYLLMVLLGSLADLSEDGASLAVIDLQVHHNQLTCETCAISLTSFLPLGSLRITDNRISAVTGQAVHVEALRYFNNVHLNVFLFREVFVYLLEQVGPDSDNEFTQVWRDLLVRWQEDSESFLEPDFRIEGNTIRSLRTAIESNIFELAIAGNHITLQERPLATTEEHATVFGQATDRAGNPLPGAMINMVGTARTIRTLQDGRYTMTGVSPGEHIFRAGRIGYYGAHQQVTLGAGEQLELNFALEAAQYWVDDLSNHRGLRHNLGNIVRVDAAPASVAPNAEIAQITDALESSQAFEPLAAALREGGYTQPRHYTEFLLSDDGPLSEQERREEAADAVSVVRGLTTDAELDDVCDVLNGALRNNDRNALWNALPRLIRGLQRYVDSQGILVKGVGCRIVENQIIVPADVQADTQAFGGIQVGVDLANLAIMVLAAQRLQEQVLRRPNEQTVTLDPLLGVTETLIDNNEVIGGIGHGISLQGAPGRPDYLQDLRIRGNQIRGLAGTAIYCNENAIVIGMNVEGNQIDQCGRSRGFTHVKGGIVARSAAVCRIHGNRVVRCGEGVVQSEVRGVDLETVYGLTFTDNELLANGSDQGLLDDGGLRLQDIYGSTTLHDNVFAYNRGTGMTWTNSAQPGEQVLLPAWLMIGVNSHLRIDASTEELVREEQASVQDNVFKTTTNTGLPVFKILNLQEVNFSGNSCHIRTSYKSLGEIENVTRLVMANNLLQTDTNLAVVVRKLNAGVILGNNGNAPCEVNLANQVEHSFNIPPIQIS